MIVVVTLSVLGIHKYADQPRAHRVCTVCTISLESEHKLTCIANL